jgi:hypothetical protein
MQGADDYFTLSSQGVTHFWEGQADFCGLEQFERDYFVYTQLMKLRMFRLFRSWKAFRVCVCDTQQSAWNSYGYGMVTELLTHPGVHFRAVV